MRTLQNIPLGYTLAFLTRGDNVLMLHRTKAPNKNLWNGVGGKIHEGEAPLAACLREVKEETGFVLPTMRFAGVLTWRGFEIALGGLYIFVAPAPDGDPIDSAEGKLAWQPRTWMCSAPEVVSNIHHFGPLILRGDPPRQYHFEYETGKLLKWEVFPLPYEFKI